MRSGLLVALLAALAGGCGTGDGDLLVGDAGTVRQPVTAAIGQTVTLTGRESPDTVQITLDGAELHTIDPDPAGAPPDQGVYLVLHATVVCTRGTYHANPYNFSLVGADGAVYEYAWTIGFEPDLDAVDLVSGQRASGKIVFDVRPAAVAGGKVRVSGLGVDYDQAAAYWRL